MSAVEDLDRLAVRTVDGWQATWRACYQQACEWEGLDPATPLVVFSPDNPIVPFVDKAYQMFCEARAGHQVVGYTGLVMANGRAREIPKAGRRTKRAKIEKHALLRRGELKSHKEEAHA